MFIVGGFQFSNGEKNCELHEGKFYSWNTLQACHKIALENEKNNTTITADNEDKHTKTTSTSSTSSTTTTTTTQNPILKQRIELKNKLSKFFDKLFSDLLEVNEKLKNKPTLKKS